MHFMSPVDPYKGGGASNETLHRRVCYETIMLQTETILCTNKNAFQLKAHLPLANRKSNTYNLPLE